MNKNHKYSGMIFLGPDDEGGGSGAPASATADPWHNNGDPDGGDAGDDGASLERQPPGGAGDGFTQPKAAPQLAAIDPKAFAASFGEVLGKTFQQHQQQQQLPPTPEQLAEARKALKFFEIDDPFIKEFGNLETQKGALEKFRDGIVQHVITVVNHLRENDKGEFSKRFETEFTPVRSMLEERKAAEQQQRFHDTYPQFADAKLAPYVNGAVAQLSAAKAFEGKSESECFDLVANFLAEGAKAYNPSFVLEKSASGGSPSPSRQGNGLPITSGGSGQSRSGGSAPSGKKSWALSHMK